MLKQEDVRLNNWKEDLSKSRNSFVTTVWPEIRFWFGNNTELIQVEEIEDFYARRLDIDAGIDYLVRDELGLRPISTRVQFDCVYSTVTIRERRSSGIRTELEKIVERVNKSYLHPWMHVQAYIVKGILVLSYAVQVSDIVKSYKNKDVWYIQTNHNDGNTFIVFQIEKLRELGINILEFSNKAYFKNKNLLLTDYDFLKF